MAEKEGRAARKAAKKDNKELLTNFFIGSKFNLSKEAMEKWLNNKNKKEH